MTMIEEDENVKLEKIYTSFKKKSEDLEKINDNDVNKVYNDLLTLTYEVLINDDVSLIVNK